MPRSVTVIFKNGDTRVYADVPDDVTPDQIEDLALRDFPGQSLDQIMMGVDIGEAHRELRDAIATRTATMADLDRIAGEYGYRIAARDRDAFQKWIDYATDNPTTRIPDDIFNPPTTRTEAVGLGLRQGVLQDTGVQGVANFASQLIADAADRFGFTPANATAWVAENILGYSREEADAMRRNLNRSDIGSFGDVVSAGAEYLENNPNVAAAQQQRANAFAVGRGAGHLAVAVPATAGAGSLVVGAGNALTRALPSTAQILRNLGLSIRSGGVGVRAPAAAVGANVPVAATRGGRIALRAAGGGGAGAIGAAATSQDISTDAMIGAAIPFIGTVARRGMSAAYDGLVRRFGSVRAAEVLRNLMADRMDEIVAALRDAPANVRANTAQFLAERGLLTPEFAAATSAVTRTAEGAPLRQVAQERAAGQEGLITELRGAETATEAAQRADAMRQAVREETDPMRQSFMERADIGRTQILPAEARAAELRNAAAEEARRAARFYRAADEQSMVLGQMDDLGDPFAAEAVNRQRGIVGGLESRGLGFGQRSVDLGAEARASQEIADNLRAQGLQPLDISGVVSNLRQQAREAAFVSPQREQLFSRFADALENRAAMHGGVIDATGLHLAKRDIGQFVANIMGQSDPSSIAQGTSMLAGQVGRLIDDAFEAAAGPEWGQYNRAFSAGMENVKRERFGAELAQLGDVSAARGGDRARFENIMAGNEPEYVENFFGRGNRDINAALFGRQLPVAHRLAREFNIDRRVANLGLDVSPDVAGDVAAGTAQNVREMFEPGRKNWLTRAFTRAPAARLTGAGGVVGDQLATDIARTMRQNMMRRLAPALADPSAALQLVGVRPTSAATAEAIDRLGTIPRAFMAQSAQQLLSPSGNPPAPSEIFLGYETGPDGREYPVFGTIEGL